MAAGTKKNDLTQIVMLTFFLCAVFFTIWGIWKSTRVATLRESRDMQAKRLVNLEKELKKPESQQAFKDDIRRKDSAENSGQIDSAVQTVLDRTQLKLKKGDPSGAPKQSGPAGNRVYEFQYTAYLNPAPIEEVYRFIAMLEAQQPHLEFKKVKVRNKKRKEEDPDEWELDLTLVTYTTES